MGEHVADLVGFGKQVCFQYLEKLAGKCERMRVEVSHYSCQVFGLHVDGVGGQLLEIKEVESLEEVDYFTGSDFDDNSVCQWFEHIAKSEGASSEALEKLLVICFQIFLV